MGRYRGPRVIVIGCYSEQRVCILYTPEQVNGFVARFSNPIKLKLLLGVSQICIDRTVGPVTGVRSRKTS
jgi:hypothetical protein